MAISYHQRTAAALLALLVATCFVADVTNASATVPISAGCDSATLLSLTNADFESQALASNNGFETTIDGWTRSERGSIGVYNPNDARLTQQPRLGDNVAFIASSDRFFEQEVSGATIKDFSKYVIKFDILDRKDKIFGTFKVELISTTTDTVFASATQAAFPTPNDGFEFAEFSVQTYTGFAQTGEGFKIRFTATSGGTWVLFDNVRIWELSCGPTTVTTTPTTTASTSGTSTESTSASSTGTTSETSTSTTTATSTATTTATSSETTTKSTSGTSTESTSASSTGTTSETSTSTTTATSTATSTPTSTPTSRVVSGSDCFDASPIALTNNGFEDPTVAENSVAELTTGWTVSGSSTGVWNPRARDISGEAFEGTQVAYIASGTGSITGTIVNSMKSNSLYVVKVHVGDRGDKALRQYEIALVAGGSEVVVKSNNDFPTPNDGYILATLELEVGGRSPMIGNSLQVVFRAAGTGTWVLFDNVRAWELSCPFTTTATTTPTTSETSTPSTSITTSPTTSPTSSETTTPSSSGTSTPTTSVTSSLSTSETTSRTTSLTSSGTSTPTTSRTTTVTTSPTTSETTSETTTETTLETSTPSTTPSTTETSTESTSPSSSPTTTETTSQTTSFTTTSTSSETTTETTSETSTPTSSFTTTSTSSETSTETTSMTSTLSTSQTSSWTTTPSTSASSTPSTSLTSTVSTSETSTLSSTSTTTPTSTPTSTPTTRVIQSTCHSPVSQTVQDFGFETPTVNNNRAGAMDAAWDQSGAAVAVYNPSTKFIPQETRQGVNVGYIASKESHVRQTLSDTPIVANKLYVMKIDILDRNDKDFREYQVAFRSSDGTLLYQSGINPVVPAKGGWDLLTVTYGPVDASTPQVGQNLVIEISTNFLGNWMLFDNVRVWEMTCPSTTTEATTQSTTVATTGTTSATTTDSTSLTSTQSTSFTTTATTSESTSETTTNTGPTSTQSTTPTSPPSTSESTTATTTESTSETSTGTTTRTSTVTSTVTSTGTTTPSSTPTSRVIQGSLCDSASPQTVNNFDFATSPALALNRVSALDSAWTTSGAAIGAWFPRTKFFASTSVPRVTPNIGYIASQGSYIRQTLSTTIAADKLYVMKVDIWDRNDKDFREYKLSFRDSSGNLIKETAINPVVPANGDFAIAVLEWEVDAMSPYIGENLMIQIKSEFQGTWLLFDNVRVWELSCPSSSGPILD